ncbi:MAG: TatD family hydrolase [Bdellovibrionales bacterium]|nr:TatD family hydrolase [Bdellovibrionales bacterium]
MNRVWDAHCHLSFFSDQQLSEILQNSPSAQETRFVQGGYNPKDWHRQLDISQRYPQRMALCFGLHPWALQKMNVHQREEAWNELTHLASKAALIGETGIDHWVAKEKASQDLQFEFFKRHLQLANSLNKPLVLHIVRAHDLCIKILRETPLSLPWAGIVHSYTGNLEWAQKYINIGFFISIGPRLLKKSDRLIRNLIASIDLKHLLIESDAPADPQNPVWDPGIICSIAETLGRIKKVSTESVMAQNQQNIETLNLFG